MSDVKQLLKRQADWQKTRQTLSWPEKIQMAERIRESVRMMRAAGNMNRTGLPGAGRATPGAVISNQ